MRIISNFTDLYDMHQPFDNLKLERHWKREHNYWSYSSILPEQKDLNDLAQRINEALTLIKLPKKISHSNIRTIRFPILKIGSIFKPYLEIEFYHYSYLEKGTYYIFSIEQLKTFLIKYEISNVDSAKFEAYFNLECTQLTNILTNYQNITGIPIVDIIIQDHYLRPNVVAMNFNDRLHPTLYKEIAPYIIYQEIDMFINNIALPENTLIEISDKYKIQQHGFDNASFRKRKSKK